MTANKIKDYFILSLFTILPIVFCIHIAFLNFFELPLFESKIILAYIINATIALIIFLLLFLLRKKYRDQLGFLFMGGSMIKFAFFFLLFYASYKYDGKFTAQEFAKVLQNYGSRERRFGAV